MSVATEAITPVSPMLTAPRADVTWLVDFAVEDAAGIYSVEFEVLLVSRCPFTQIAGFARPALVSAVFSRSALRAGSGWRIE
jgi:hypothetical protein